MSNRSRPMATHVRATLEAKAGQITVRPRPFDADRPVRLVEAVRSPTPSVTRPRPTRRRRLVVGLAAVAVAAVLGAVAIAARQEGGHDGTTATAATTTTEAEAGVDGVLAPSWSPDDLTLWAVTWDQSPSGSAGIGHEQLFGRDGDTADGAVHVWIQPGQGGVPVGTDPTTVRGVQADLMPAKEFPDTTSALSWYEDDVGVTAEFVGIGVEDVVAFLDGLTWRSADRLEGFAPPEGGDLTFLGETSPASPGGTILSARFLYLDAALNQAPGEGRQLSVRTSTATGGGLSPSYLQTWFHADRGDDGVLDSYDPRYGTLRRDWPDGRTLWVDANATAVDQDTLVQVADSVEAVTATELTQLREAVRDRVGGQDLVASAELGDARLEVRGTGAMAVLCLQPVDGAPICSSGVVAGGSAGGLATGFVVGDTWYAAAAATGVAPVVSEPSPALPSAGAEPLPGSVAATSGEWSFALVAVPAGFDTVDVWYGTQGSNLQRSRAEE